MLVTQRGRASDKKTTLLGGRGLDKMTFRDGVVQDSLKGESVSAIAALIVSLAQQWKLSKPQAGLSRYIAIITAIIKITIKNTLINVQEVLLLALL